MNERMGREAFQAEEAEGSAKVQTPVRSQFQRVRFFGTTKWFSGTSSLLTLSTWDSIRFCRLRSQSHKAASPPQTPVTGWAVTSLVFLTHWLSLRGSHCPLLGFDYFPRVASRTQRNLSFTRLLAMIKGYHSGTVRWKRCIGWGWGRDPELPRSQHAVSPSVHRLGSSLKLALLSFYGGFTT